MTNLIALPSGTELVNDFRIERVLGAGGFGITYLANEIALARAVTIKEYFPSDFAYRREGQDAAPRSHDCAEDYDWGLDRFIEEAQTLAKFNHPNIVRVYRYFRENNTGYMVLHFEEGQSLKSWLKGLNRAPRQKELDRIIAPLLDALALIHDADFLHRDIAPDNIIIRKDGTPVLIDFGSARGEIVSHSKTVSALVKPGYSPYEQYAETSRQQGPWTDIYALAATLYHAIAGHRPPDSPSRMVKDEIVPARQAALSSYRPRFLRALDKALTLSVEGRPQSVAEWRGELLGEEPAPRRSWIGRGAAPRDKAAAMPDDPAGASPVPPPPDAPGPSGGILDFVDGLRERSFGRAAGPAAGATAGHAGGPDADVKSRPPRDTVDSAADQPQAAKSGTVRLDAPPKAFVFPRLKPKKEAVAKAPAKANMADPIAEASEAFEAPLRQDRKKAAKQSRPAQPPLREPIEPKPRGRALVPAGDVASDAGRRKPPRPSTPGRWRSWLSIGFKLAVGAGIAAVAVANQDTLRHFDIGRLFQEPVATVPGTPVANPDRSTAAETITRDAADTPARTVAVPTAPIVRPAPKPAPLNPLIAQVASQPEKSTAIAFVDDGQHVVTAGEGARLSIHDGHTGDLLRVVELDHGAAISIATQGNLIATGHLDGHIEVWDLNTGEKLSSLQRNEASIWSLGFTSEAGHLVAAGHDWKVALWDINAPTSPVHVFEGHDSAVQAVAVSKGSGMMASGGADRAMRVWNLKTLDPVRTYRRHRDFITAAAFRDDGRYLVSGSLDGELRLWSASSRRMLRRLRGHKGAITSVAFSRGGTLIASSSKDGTIRIWNPKTGRTLRTLAGQTGEVAGLAFSGDGRRLASTGDDGKLRLWSVEAAVGRS